MATERINIVVAQRGAQQVRRELDGIGQGGDRAARSLSLLNRALAAVGLGIGLGVLRQTADAYTSLSNRLRLVANDSRNLAEIQEAVFQASQRTRTSFEAMAILYGRTAMNTRALGISQQDVLDLTETVAQAFRISGATAAESRGAIIQFTQGLAQGALRGQELLSVMEQAPRLGQAIAEGMGIAYEDLKRLGETGEITTTKIIAALKKSAPELAAEFANIRPTIDDAFTVLHNGFLRTIGMLDEATGASQMLARAMIELGNNTGLMTAGIISMATILTAVLIPALWSAVVAATALTAALLANPIAWIGLAIAGLVMFGDQIKVSEDGIVSLLDWIKAAGSVLMEYLAPVGQFLMDVFGQAWDFLAETWGGVSTFFAENFDELVELASVFYRVYVALFNGLVRAIVAIFQNLPAAIELVFKTMFNSILMTADLFLTALADGINSLITRVGMQPVEPPDLSQFKQDLSDAASDIPGVITTAFQEGFAEGDLIAQRALEHMGNVLTEINSRAREIAVRRLADEANRPDGTLSDLAGVPDPRGGDGKLDKATETRLKNLLEDIKGAQGELAQGLRDLDILLSRGSITIDEYNKKLRELTLAAIDASLELGDGLTTGLMKVQDELADVAQVAEDLVVNAFQNAEDALVKFVTTGQLDFKQFVDSLLADLARLAIRQAILGPLAGAMGGMFGFSKGGLVGFARGGQVSGPGTGTSDSILAWLSNKEFVVNAASTEKFLPLLHAINDDKVPGFVQGGLVGGSSGSGRVSVNVIDQRANGGEPISITRHRAANGDEDIRVVVRDEVARINRATKDQRRKEVRSFVISDKAVGNL